MIVQAADNVRDREPRPVYRIAYMSHAVRGLGEDGLTRLCDHAARRNATLDLTGLILHDGTGFLQALEGERAAVEDVMHAIAADVRHHSITFLANGGTTSRQFGNAPMRLLRAHHGQTMRNFLLEVKAEVKAVDDVALQATFIGFAALAASRTNSRQFAAKPLPLRA